MICDCELILELCARGERAHVITEPFARRRSSWTTLEQAHDWLWTFFIRASSETMMKQARDLFKWLNWSCTEPCARQAHRLLWPKLMIDCQLIIKRAIGPLDGNRAHETMNNMMKQARDLFHLETLLLRARSAATKLINNAMKQAHDWLWTLLIRAMCTATELM